MLKRMLFNEILPQLYHKNAIVITGMRQVGKSTLMRQLFNVFEGKRLWFDLDNPLDQLVFENLDYNVKILEHKLIQWIVKIKPQSLTLENIEELPHQG